MTDATFAPPRPPTVERFARLGYALARFATAAWRQYVEWRVERELRALHAAVDDKALAEFGLTAADIEASYARLLRPRRRM